MIACDDLILFLILPIACNNLKSLVRPLQLTVISSKLLKSGPGLRSIPLMNRAIFISRRVKVLSRSRLCRTVKLGYLLVLLYDKILVRLRLQLRLCRTVELGYLLVLLYDKMDRNDFVNDLEIKKRI